jgi:hypothetical protein
MQDVPYQPLPGGNKFTIPAQGEFSKGHPGMWLTFFTVEVHLNDMLPGLPQRPEESEAEAAALTGSD